MTHIPRALRCLVGPLCLLAGAVSVTPVRAGEYGACCLPDGGCIQTSSLECLIGYQGVFHGIGSSCLACVETGRCCLPDGQCVVVTTLVCEIRRGIYEPNASCAAFVCCNADINGDGAVTVDDLLAVIIEWGPCPEPPVGCPADIDGDGAVTVDDLLAVIIEWGPCD